MKEDRRETKTWPFGSMCRFGLNQTFSLYACVFVVHFVWLCQQCQAGGCLDMCTNTHI